MAVGTDFQVLRRGNPSVGSTLYPGIQAPELYSSTAIAVAGVYGKTPP